MYDDFMYSEPKLICALQKYNPFTYVSSRCDQLFKTIDDFTKKLKENILG